jgi:hypothetical protein
MATGALVPRSDLTPSDHPMTTSAPANLDRLDEPAAAQRDASGRPAPDPACARFAVLPKTSSPELDTRIHLCACNLGALPGPCCTPGQTLQQYPPQPCPPSPELIYQPFAEGTPEARTVAPTFLPGRGVEQVNCTTSPADTPRLSLLSVALRANEDRQAPESSLGGMGVWVR